MDTPVVLFGAFDRHNLGDLMFPHIAQAMLGDVLVRFAGLAARDLRDVGGHRVEAIGELIAGWGDGPATLVHVGGETLTCPAFEAAVMLLDARELPPLLAHFAAQPEERAAWARRCTGVDSPAPYVLSRRDWPGLGRVVHAGVGGVDLDRIDAPLRDAVLARLREADAIAVRDLRTQAALRRHGLDAALMPDPAVLVAELFGPRIARHGCDGEPAAVRAAFPRGYLAVQCSALFADDATLDSLAAALARVQADRGLGVVLLRAGAAPWHDDLAVLRRLAARLEATSTRLAGTLDIWDLCALIAGSVATIGSSLHARIVAGACGRPCVSLQPSGDVERIRKIDAWVETWEPTAAFPVTTPGRLGAALHTALDADPAALREQARNLAQRCRDGFAALRA
ncbi:MAG: polysaccharide pyruvyl transferase family protein [Piscinibacter sp.]|uniref:polysaccharide pyruvyl transferase family protein n=1 Tax=Piscinibacter sp. TaxID=1903157 RepID=UPI003D1101DB